MGMRHIICLVRTALSIVAIRCLSYSHFHAWMFIWHHYSSAFFPFCIDCLQQDCYPEGRSRKDVIIFQSAPKLNHLYVLWRLHRNPEHTTCLKSKQQMGLILWQTFSNVFNQEVINMNIFNRMCSLLHCETLKMLDTIMASSLPPQGLRGPHLQHGHAIHKVV
ncbi:hypothetical protein XELAEV_18025931mg [Xenopus laevis]|uniref:Uncharacterized protein n=1 Tax=Xenopus laevis TaxID=8355 RepID=A0A974HMD1_XENLA|nr:hypothetical protein XELAEV_18025931mg [Xenopus laevis]